MCFKLAGKASILGAFFVCSTAFAAASSKCTSTAWISWHTVSYIYDGDTIKLANGDKVRFIGINTPEIAKKDRPAEPFADHARKVVQQAIGNKGRIGLMAGGQAQDRYGRRLAHVFLPPTDDNPVRNLTAQLLAKGLGSQIVIPPNLKFINCYQQAQSQARSNNRGIWSLPGQGVIAAHRLSPDAAGFKRVSGQITRVGHGKSNVWLNFGDALAVKIVRKDLKFFKPWEPHSLVNKKIEVSGWVYTRNRKKRMQIHHPKMMRIIE